MDLRFYYKLELVYVKYSPMIISLGLLLNNILSYFLVFILHEIGSILFGTSLLTISYLYNSSKTFNFCKYHRMFIHYILLNNIINLTDYYIGIPIDNRLMLALNLVIGGIFLFLILYYYKKYGDRNYDANNKKVVTANNCRYRCG